MAVSRKGKGGPKGKTIEQHQIDGTFNKSRHGNIIELMPKPDAVDASSTTPWQLSPAGKRQWRKWAPVVAKAGVLKETDIPLFCQLCEVMAELRQCERDEKELDRQYQVEDQNWNINGLYRNANGNIVENPKTQLKARLRNQALKLWAEFGMTPIARKQIVVEKPKEESKWDKFTAPARKNG
ncbi:MAG: phage terminase small subunit P27 family [Chlorobiaceae bacterium]|nr:phage terminase small subunit P27 family [Chlorobiaceae bacterium]